MGSHRKTIKRKKPLTQTTIKSTHRRDVIKSLHNDLKANKPRDDGQFATYQQASSKGQDPQHGGDSSKILVPWLRAAQTEGTRVLEVGCLECDNAIAKFVEHRKGSIRRIDLKSRDPRIEEQDFMTLPLADGEKYDLISLSLVLNFVPTPQRRYDMLKRTTLLMKTSTHELFPALFIVLPLPCVSNSRYLTQERFLEVMKSLGYQVLRSKESKRMAYWLFQWGGQLEEKTWKKEVINDGKTRNNFAIYN